MRLYAKHWLQASIALICSLALLFTCVSARADEDIENLENNSSDLKDQLIELNSEMVALSDEISSTEEKIELMNSELLRIQDSLKIAKENEEQQYEDMKIRIKFMYESGNTSLLEMLFSAKNMADFLNKADFIQNISDYDRSMLEELHTMKETIASEETALQEQQASLTETQNQLKERKAELEAKAEATSTDLVAFLVKLNQLRKEEAKRQEEEALKNGETAVSPGSHQANAPSVTADEMDVFAAILECEAYQNYSYMLAVATVIMNRIESPRFGNSILEVVYAYGQFAPVWNGRLDAVLKRGATPLSYQVAQDALNGSRLPEVADCYYFLYAGSTNRKGVNIGNNLFFSKW